MNSLIVNVYANAAEESRCLLTYKPALEALKGLAKMRTDIGLEVEFFSAVFDGRAMNRSKERHIRAARALDNGLPFEEGLILYPEFAESLSVRIIAKCLLQQNDFSAKAVAGALNRFANTRFELATKLLSFAQGDIECMKQGATKEQRAMLEELRLPLIRSIISEPSIEGMSDLDLSCFIGEYVAAYFKMRSQGIELAEPSEFLQWPD